MKFSHAMVVLVATTVYALPQGQSPGSWSDWPQSSSAPAPTQGNNIPDSGEPAAPQVSPIPVNLPTVDLNVGQGQPQSSPPAVASPAPVNAAGGQNNAAPGGQQAAPTSASPTLPQGTGGPQGGNLGDQQASPAPAAPVSSPLPAGQQASPAPAPATSRPPPAGQQASPAPSPAVQQGQWSDWPQTTPSPSPAPVVSPAPAGPNRARDLGPQLDGQPSNTPVPQANANQNPETTVGAPGTSPSPSASPNGVFQAPAAQISSTLGADPSSTCTWEFVLTCASQASTAGSTCMAPMAESSTNCFSQPACAAAIGNNAGACASCFTSLGKQQFIKACYAGQSNSNVAPVFQAMVSYGVCDAQGVELHA